MSEHVVNAAPIFSGWIRQVSGMYGKDLRAISQEDYTGSCGGVCRSPHDFTAEVCGVNRWVTNLLKNQPAAERTDEEKAAYKASLATIEAGAAEILATSHAMADAVDAAGPRLSETITAPWGQTLTLAELVNIMANHIMYHDGQITYLQSYRGDGEMHWFDE